MLIVRFGKSPVCRHGTLVFLLLGLLTLAGCGPDTPDCFQTAGDTVREEVAVDSFSAITVFEHVRLVISQGPEQKVVIETGENLRPEVSARVRDGVLELRNGNTCNFFRDYGETVIRVSSPELREIRSSTGWPIVSEGTLAYSDLRLISESFNNPETETTDGSFDLDLDAGEVQVVLNGIASVRLRGRASQLQVVIAAGDSRVQAQALQADRVRVDHRGSNDILVFPLQRIEGIIRGYGDVISRNRPPEIAVQEIFRGRLIFEN